MGQRAAVAFGAAESPVESANPTTSGSAGPGGDLPHGVDRAGILSPNPLSTFRAKYWISTNCGGLRRSIARIDSEKLLDTPAHIYYKYEGTSPAGSHKPNTAVPQAYYNKRAGIKRLATETGAGQWGSALALACRMFGMECTVYMVRVSYDQKPYRRMMMHTWGAEVFASPSDHTNSGRAVLAETPDSPGSLGIAISEAVEDAATHTDTNYALGSVLNHVMLHQTVIGQEAKLQMEQAGEEPEVVIGCFGGGSNFGGLALPYVLDRLAGKGPRIVAVEPSACPSLTKGVFAYDYGDTAKLTPLIKMYTLGHDFVPPGIHAGGLRYHGASPLLSHLIHQGHIQAKAYSQLPVFEAASAVCAHGGHSAGAGIVARHPRGGG